MSKFDGSPVYIVADCVGRGHIKPFGRFTREQKGTVVDIGGKNYKVTSDGRVSIPKRIMEKYGFKDPATGRNVVIARCSSTPGPGERRYAIQILKPKQLPLSVKTHQIARLRNVQPGVENVLSPHDSGDWSFSE